MGNLTKSQLVDKSSFDYITDKNLLIKLITERKNKVSNPFSPLANRLGNLLQSIKDNFVPLDATDGRKVFRIEVEGATESDVLSGIDEARKSIENGNHSGFDGNEDGEYSFESSGRYSDPDEE